MNKLRAAFFTLGCKLNFSETSSISKDFSDRGFKLVDFSEIADVYVINTCTVTENADRECRQIIRRAKRTNPEAYVLVTGCYAQLRSEEISKIEGVNAVFGTNEKFQIFSHLENFNKLDSPRILVGSSEKIEDFHFASSNENDDRTRAFFKIQDGCDYKCTFCTIPLARGESRSLSISEVAEQFQGLINSGYKEVVLTGVNVGDYGRKPDEFYLLLRKLIEFPGDYRIRISSIEPNLLTDNILDLAASSSKLCDHFHIPLQSGSQEILRLMQRRYKASEFETLISKISAKFLKPGIGIDVITGFPGENEEHFLETYSLLRDLPISYLHVFTYSDRTSTKASSMENKIHPAIKKERNHRLRILSEKKKNEFYRMMIGDELNVIFEDSVDDGKMRGFTSNYVRVEHPFKSDLVNKIKKIKIQGVVNNICVAGENELVITEQLT